MSTTEHAEQNAAFNCVGEETQALSGDAVRSHNPAHPDETVWSASSPVEAVASAVAAARNSLDQWRRAGIEKRIEVVRAFQAIATERVEEMGKLICRETGKAIWDSMGEAKLLAAKVDITLDQAEYGGLRRVTDFELELTPSRRGVCSFRPHGVMAVIGPFNFPAHLPNGHIIPALITGNTIVFKPSDKAPAVGQLLASWYREALDQCGMPRAVLNLVHGAVDVASRLVGTSADGGEEVDGILFTGSWPVGRRILEANLDAPGRIVALEMGGNNPAIIMPDTDLKHAAVECVRAAYITTGQRCTCTRRIVVHEEIADRFIPLFQRLSSNLLVGDPMGVGGGSRNQSVFMGPIITSETRDAVLNFQSALLNAGGRSLVEATAVDHPSGGHYLSPGLVQVEAFSKSEDSRDSGCDIEVFGPLTRLSIVDSLESAIKQANATRYGLASSIFTHAEDSIEEFLHCANAGCVNVNTGTAGASGKLPFGGVGLSGNHRAAGSFSLDYTAFPVASMVEREPDTQIMPGMHFDDAWLSSEKD